MKNLQKRSDKNLRILIGYSETAGYFGSLNKGFRKLGIKSDFVDISSHRFMYQEPSTDILIGNLRKLLIYYETIQGQALRFVILQLMRTLRLLLFIRLIFKYNVFILSSFQTLIGSIDLPILKLFGKKVIYVFMGTDSRPSYISGNVIETENDKIKNLRKLYDENLIRKNLTKRIEKYADYLVNHPPSALFQTKQFILISCIGFPFVKERSTDYYLDSQDNADALTRILHAPSKPLIKGTPLLKEIIAQLIKKGHRIELIEIVNKPNNVVLEELSKCDFVVDEFYSDAPLGGLGTEAAFFGKPTINGGYYSVEIKNDYPAESIPPALYCLPEKMMESIELMITNREYRLQLGQQARDFVLDRWEASVVAKKFLNLIYNEVPPEWIFDPKNFSYIFGYGQSKDRLKFVLQSYVEMYGETALFLDDKPWLLEKFRQLNHKQNPVSC